MTWHEAAAPAHRKRRSRRQRAVMLNPAPARLDPRCRISSASLGMISVPQTPVDADLVLALEIERHPGAARLCGVISLVCWADTSNSRVGGRSSGPLGGKFLYSAYSHLAIATNRSVAASLKAQHSEGVSLKQVMKLLQFSLGGEAFFALCGGRGRGPSTAPAPGLGRSWSDSGWFALPREKQQESRNPMIIDWCGSRRSINA